MAEPSEVFVGAARSMVGGKGGVKSTTHSSHFKSKNNFFSVSERKGSMVRTSHIFTFLAKILLSIYFPMYVQVKKVRQGGGEEIPLVQVRSNGYALLEQP